jgi:hypothetical protein
MSVSSFSIAERQREKNESRLRGEARLADGQQNGRDLAEQNGFFSALDPSRARISHRRVRLQSA